MKNQLTESINNLIKLVEDVDFHSRVEESIRVISSCLNNGHSFLVFGNGGSASDALHISGELVGRFNHNREALNVVCLNSNVTVLTAWSNDFGYDSVFSRQIEAHASEGSVVMALSTSGNSPSVVKALKAAKAKKLFTVAMTGQGGGNCAPYADILLDVPSIVTPRIQEMHLPIYHYMCSEIEKRCIGKS